MGLSEKIAAILNNQMDFIGVIVGGILIKVLTSEWVSPPRLILSVFTALYCAIVFTDPVLRFLGLEPATYRNAIAALLTLTGEGLVRVLFRALKDQQLIERLIKAWRGK